MILRVVCRERINGPGISFEEAYVPQEGLTMPWGVESVDALIEKPHGVRVVKGAVAFTVPWPSIRYTQETEEKAGAGASLQEITEQAARRITGTPAVEGIKIAIRMDPKEAKLYAESLLKMAGVGGRHGTEQISALIEAERDEDGFLSDEAMAKIEAPAFSFDALWKVIHHKRRKALWPEGLPRAHTIGVWTAVDIDSSAKLTPEQKTALIEAHSTLNLRRVKDALKLVEKEKSE